MRNFCNEKNITKGSKMKLSKKELIEIELSIMENSIMESIITDTGTVSANSNLYIQDSIYSEILKYA